MTVEEAERLVEKNPDLFLVFVLPSGEVKTLGIE
jgi:hypothetical protein